MNPTDISRWLDPQTWPFPVYIWLAFGALSFVSAAWRRHKQNLAAGWPTTPAHIESATVERPKIFGLTDSRRWSGVVAYSYSAMGSTYSGRYSRTFDNAASAQDFVRDLESKTVTISFDPDKPANSVLTDAALEVLLRSRPEAQEEEQPMPIWMQRLLWPATITAGCGLVLSICVHGAALFGKTVGGFPLFIALHAFAILLGFLAVPAIKSFYRGKLLVRRRDVRELLSDTPAWMSMMVYVFCAYAFVNFFIFFLQLPSGRTQGTTPAEWRGFSGHWMAFYSAEMSAFYAALVRLRKRPRCLNGHPAWRPGDFCTKCGQPVIRS